MKLLKLKIDKELVRLLIEVLKNPDVMPETKEEIASSALDFIRPKYIVDATNQLLSKHK